MAVQLSEKHKEYWRKTLTITVILLFIWFVITFVVGYYARELHDVTILGFPLAFYMGAQGSLVIYIVIIGVYAWYMNRLDRTYGVQEGEEQ